MQKIEAKLMCWDDVMNTDSLLDTITFLILNNFPTYIPWAESTGFFLQANAHYKAYLPGGGHGIPLTFNPLGIGPSRLGYKTTGASIVRPILKGCGIHIESDYTSEAFTSYAQAYVKAHPDDIYHCAILRDEAKGIVDDGNKKFKANGLTFLCSLLDPGIIDSRNTLIHGLEEDLPCRVNFMGAMQPAVLGSLDEAFWTVGTGNRLTTSLWTPKILDQRQTISRMTPTDFDRGIDRCIELMKRHMATKVEHITYSEDVADKVIITELSDWRKGYKDFFDDPFSILPAYQYECQVFMQKVAAFKAFDRQIDCTEPEVSMDDYKYAIAWVKDRYDEFTQVYELWKEAKSRGLGPSNALSLEEKIINLIKHHGSASLALISNNIRGASSEEKKRVAEAMFKVGKINQKEVGNHFEYILPESKPKSEEKKQVVLQNDPSFQTLLNPQPEPQTAEMTDEILRDLTKND